MNKCGSPNAHCTAYNFFNIFAQPEFEQTTFAVQELRLDQLNYEMVLLIFLFFIF